MTILTCRTLSKALLCAAAVSAPAMAAAPQDPFLKLSIQDAAVRAQKEDKLLLIYFHNDIVVECDRMMARTWKDERVLSWIADNAVPVLVPATDINAHNRFGVSTYPYVVLAAPEGQKVLHMVKGYSGPTDFLIEANVATVGTEDGSAPQGEDLQNPMAWLAWANWLFTNAPSRHAECLDAYVWCLDNGEEYLPGFRGRHFEFLCQRIAWLRNLTQAAADVMFLRRERLRATILAGLATEAQASDYIRYCFWLRDEVNVLETVEAMRDLGEKHNAIARQLVRAELNRAVGRQLYSDILRLDPSPLALTNARFKELDKVSEDLRGKASDYMKSRSDIVFAAACYFEALLGTNRAGDAMELFDRVVTKVPTGRAFFTFMERTNRLRVFTLTHRIAKQGLEVVGEKGRRTIEMELKKIEVLKQIDSRKKPADTQEQASGDDR